MINKDRSFPESFLWGASIAAHQVEGGNNNQWSEWELVSADRLAAESPRELGAFNSWPEIKSDSKNPSNYISGGSVDHYSMYETDFDILKNMNMNSFRFSVEWSRIEPEDGLWDYEQIEYYKKYIKKLNSLGIKPVVTFFHFTLPVWFSEKGGFEKRDNISYFVRFVKKIATELRDDLEYIVTINEPEVYSIQSYIRKAWPPAVCNYYSFWKVINNLIAAHNQVAVELRKINGNFNISIAKNSVFVNAINNSIYAKCKKGILQYLQDDYILSRVIENCDYIGLNYYVSLDVSTFKTIGGGVNRSDLNWRMRPSDIQYVLERLSRKYNKPILITENGVADAKDRYRKWWITETISAIQRAMANNSNVIGYMHWSLLDNFEWSYGFWPKFGLVSVSKTGKRKLRPSAVWFGSVIGDIVSSGRFNKTK